MIAKQKIHIMPRISKFISIQYFIKLYFFFYYFMIYKQERSSYFCEIDLDRIGDLSDSNIVFAFVGCSLLGVNVKS